MHCTSFSVVPVLFFYYVLSTMALRSYKSPKVLIQGNLEKLSASIKESHNKVQRVNKLLFFVG